MRSRETYFRKPVNYNHYHILLVRSHGLWCIDSQDWSESVIHHAEREERRINPSNSTKIVTSPSDDERVVSKIVAEMNRFNR